MPRSASPVHQVEPLGDAERVRLAGGAKHRKPVAAIGEQPARVGGDAVEIDREIVAHRASARPRSRRHRSHPASFRRFLPSRARQPPGPVRDMVFERARLPLVDHPPAHRDAGLVHRLADCPRPAGATRRGRVPRRAGDRRRRAAASRARRTASGVRRTQSGTWALAMRVVAAAAGFGVEQPAGDVGEGELAGVVVAQLVQAAAAAAVAQALPLGGSTSPQAACVFQNGTWVAGIAAP